MKTIDLLGGEVGDRTVGLAQGFSFLGDRAHQGIVPGHALADQLASSGKREHGLNPDSPHGRPQGVETTHQLEYLRFDPGFVPGSCPVFSQAPGQSFQGIEPPTGQRRGAAPPVCRDIFQYIVWIDHHVILPFSLS